MKITLTNFISTILGLISAVSIIVVLLLLTQGFSMAQNEAYNTYIDNGPCEEIVNFFMNESVKKPFDTAWGDKHLVNHNDKLFTIFSGGDLYYYFKYVGCGTMFKYKYYLFSDKLVYASGSFFVSMFINFVIMINPDSSLNYKKK